MEHEWKLDNTLYHVVLSGLSPDNEAWIERKKNVVNRFSHSSYYIRGTGVIGTITVSGLPSEDDHTLIIEVLTDYLGGNHEISQH